MRGLKLFLLDLSSWINLAIQSVKNAQPDTIRKVSVLLVAYLVTARLGLSVDPVSGFATFFWMPTGISLSFLILYGRKFWPAIFLGALLSNLSNGGSIPVSVGIAFGNTAEALAGFYLLNRYGFRPSLQRVKDVVLLIVFGASISTVISASIGAESLFLGGMLTAAFINTWTTWWVGDMLSNLIVAPFIMTWVSRENVRLEAVRIFEAILVSTLVLIVGLLVFTGAAGIFF